jgi:hypothetical protein
MYQKGTAQAIGIVRPRADQVFGEERIVRYAPAFSPAMCRQAHAF